METKFIITKDGKHYKSDWLEHYTIARDNGYSVSDILETGLIVDNKFFILECYVEKHRNKISHMDKWIGNDVKKYMEDFQNYRLMKMRETESVYAYDKNRIGLREGD